MARLAFFGTPNFSLPSLRAVHRFCADFGHELVLVVSQLDQPQGRGKQTLAPPVKSLAIALGVRVMQPATLKKGTEDGDGFFEQFTSLNIDFAIVVAYGKLIPERLLKNPKCGFVNVHGSLLPRFRGAAPVQRAIEAGDPVTGVCLMDMVKKLDEGDVYLCQKTPIMPFDTSDTLFRRLANMGADLLYHSLGQLLLGSLSKQRQAEDGVVYAHMVKKDEGVLNFFERASLISRKARAFDPWPGAFGFVRGKRVKFFESFFIADPHVARGMTPGTVVVTGVFLGIKAMDGIVYFQAMQVEGKKALPIKAALLGFPIAVGEKIMTTVT